MTYVTLNTGFVMPLIGLGTFKTKGYDIIYSTLDAALACGYRSFDTASVYTNEEDIGKALKALLPKHALDRKDIFVTSKLAPRDQGEKNCRAACLGSVQRLGMDYLDLYLIHWPGTHGMKPDDPRHPAGRAASWRDMEALHREGVLRSIGVSNYTAAHLTELFQLCSTPPAVLQVEHHPHLYQGPLMELCKQHGVHFQAYSSLGTMTSHKLLADPVVERVAGDTGRSPAQVLLRWAVQQGVGVLPKSTNPAHLQENMDILDWSLSDEHMSALTDMDTKTKYCWDPSTVT